MFVREVKKIFTQIDILINNAGMIVSKLYIAQYFKCLKSLAVNYYCHFYLAHLLYLLICNSSDDRIIDVSSDDHRFAPKYLIK